MARKTKEQLEKIKKDNNVENIFSWSRYNCYKNSSYEYFLKYIKKEKETRNNVYSLMGSSSHSCLDDYYNGKIKYEDMYDEFQSEYLNATLMDLKFNRSDDEKNEKIAIKYKACMDHFFKKHIPIEHDLITEKYILIWVNKFLFGGYFDAIHKDKDGNYVITDWKSSTIYTGKKIDQEKGQLLLYAEGIRQMGIPLERIKIRWAFLKYLTISMPLKKLEEDGITRVIRTTNAERHAWVGKVKSNASMWLKELDTYTKEEIDDMLDYSVNFNTIENLPQEIQDLYTIEDCYVEALLTEEEIDNLKDDIYKTLVEIYTKEKEYEKTKDDIVFWEEVTQANSYYFANLCGFNAQQHLPYGKFLDSLESFVDDEYKVDKNRSELSYDWMSELNL